MQWSGYDCKVFSHISCNRSKDQERNTEEKSEPECATTLEQVRVTSGSKQPGVYSGALEELAVSVPLVAPIVLP
jgi:uncharacterized ferredoxin-like protein